MKKRIVIADSHASVRQMLSEILESEEQHKVVAEAGTGLEALSACRRHRPDLAILDATLPELCGAGVTQCLRAERLPVRVLLFTGAASRKILGKALHCQPNGLVRREDSLPVLLEAVRVVARGGSYFTPFAMEACQKVQPDEFSPFSERESEVLQMIAESRSSKQIAQRLGVAAKTVENHRHRLMKRAQVHDIAGLTRYAIHQGVVW